ncbi:MAG TPA: AMP-binding protein [Chloroflexota bacterium]|nr:AMP-binding protein [Chloroflexota bacterium]
MTDVRFHWTSPGMVPARHAVYPPEEGDRTEAWSDRLWSAVEALPLERLRAIQLAKLQRVVAFAWERSPFYRRLWEQHGVAPAAIQALDDVRRLPVVRKEDFEASQQARPLFGDIPTAPPGSPTFMKFWSTSGSTGQPRLWLATKEDHENDMYLFLRAFYAYGVRPGMRGYFGFAYPPFEAFWKAHYAAEAMGCQVIPKGPLPTAVILRNLTRWHADFMVCTPTFALRQAEVARQEGIDLRAIGIKIIVVAGEPGGSLPGTKALIEELWGGARVCDAFGMTEISGPVLFTCDSQATRPAPLAHMGLDYTLFEIVDPDTLEPVAAGQEGGLIVTSLFRLGMPVVRMFTNDLVEVTAERCDCGRSFPLVRGGVRGRLDDVIFYKGIKVSPAAAEVAVRAVPGLGLEFRLELRGEALTLTAEALDAADPAGFPALAAALQQEFTRLTTLRIPATIVPAGTLARAEMKSRRVVRQ